MWHNNSTVLAVRVSEAAAIEVFEKALAGFYAENWLG